MAVTQAAVLSYLAEDTFDRHYKDKDVYRTRVSLDLLEHTDLVAAFNNKDDPEHQLVRSILTQINTNLGTLNIELGAICTWAVLYLVYRPWHDRDTLYISKRILSNNSYTETNKDVTLFGGIAYIAYEALRTAHDTMAGMQQPDNVSDVSNGDECGGDVENGTEGMTMLSGDAGPLLDDRVPQQRQFKRVTDSQAALQQPQTQPPLMMVTQLELVQKNDDHAVFTGVFMDQDVFVKTVFKGGYWIYEAELAAYEALKELQGRLIPVLLCAGWMSLPSEDSVCAVGKHLTIARVPGQPLYMHTLNHDQKHAVYAAFKQLQQAVPGFLHGDIKGHNIIMLDDVGGINQDEAYVPCRFIDFGLSRLNGSPEQQAGELAILRHVLGI